MSVAEGASTATARVRPRAKGRVSSKGGCCPRAWIASGYSEAEGNWKNDCYTVVAEIEGEQTHLADLK